MKSYSKIGIIGAMPEEIEPIIAKLKNVKKTNYASNIFYEGIYNGKSIVVAKSKIGKVFSTLTASSLIQKFDCEVVLFSGVAGAISPELNIGDIVVASSLCQHDVDISSFGHPHGFIPESSTFIETTIELKDLAMKISDKKNVHIYEGIIATGDQFISSQDKKDWISTEFDACAIEMEGASVAIVCSSLNIPFFILRAISDSSNMDATFNFDKFVKSSAKISANFILSMIDEL